MAISKYLEFKIKYITPVIAILLTYGVIAMLYTRSLAENDLITIKGRVSAMRQDTLRNNKSNTLRITFRLLDNDNNFFLFASTDESYDLIIQSVVIGDSISILRRTKLQSIFGMGSEFQIMKLEKDNDILYSFNDATAIPDSTLILGILAMVGLWILYFYLKYWLKLKKRQLKTTD